MIILKNSDCLEALFGLPENSVDACVSDPPYFIDSIQKRFGKPGSAVAKSKQSGVFTRKSQNWIGQQWDTADKLPFDADFGHYFAGFTDGEGSFQIIQNNYKGAASNFKTNFSISLRADDVAILHEFREKLGIGKVYERPIYGDPVRHKNPEARFTVTTQQDCLVLREIFNNFPLRAKKARDFAIWSDALDEWIAREWNSGWEQLAYLKEQMEIARKFNGQYHPEEIFMFRVGHKLIRVLKPGGYLMFFASTKNVHRIANGLDKAGFIIQDTLLWLYGTGMPASHTVAEGVGTRLKPGTEMIILAQKPPSERTLKANYEKWGVGGLNIEACRLPCGRYPSNVLHDGSEQVTEIFKEQGAADAHRFFYCSKPTGDERKSGNGHPTMKPISLMQYLVRLATPPQGVVLDPFMGTGTTGIAAVNENLSFVGIEREPAYFATSYRRIMDAKRQKVVDGL